MATEKLKALISSIREITATDEYAMTFLPGAADEEIFAFEQEHGIVFPKLVANWLRFADGCCLFDTLISFYGVARGQRISVQGDGYICIGIFNYGDAVCVKSGSDQIYLCGETVIEYGDFNDFLALVMDIGMGDEADG